MSTDDEMIQFIHRLAKDLFDVTIANLKMTGNMNSKTFSGVFNLIISGYITSMMHTLKQLSSVDKEVERGTNKFIEAFQEHLMKFDDLSYFAKYDENGLKEVKQ